MKLPPSHAASLEPDVSLESKNLRMLTLLNSQVSNTLASRKANIGLPAVFGESFDGMLCVGIVPRYTVIAGAVRVLVYKAEDTRLIPSMRRHQPVIRGKAVFSMLVSHWDAVLGSRLATADS